MIMKVVLTGGKFNRIHPGHVWLLKKAKKLGYLVVVLAHESFMDAARAAGAAFDGAGQDALLHLVE